tara:strand:+ start:5648 stop:5845 length:198 start_codon:yes stop_codon:yes gene_type:complete
MHSVDTSITFIRAYADATGIKPASLAVQAGLSINALRDLHKDTWNPTVETLRKVLAVIPSDSPDG